MGFITSKRSSQLTRTKSCSRKGCQSSQFNHISGGQGKNEEHRRNSDAGLYEIEDIELEKQVKLAEEMSKGNDSMWLSLDFSSLSLCVSDASGDIWELNSSNLSPKDKLEGMTSLHRSSESSVYLLKKKALASHFETSASTYCRTLRDKSPIHGSSSTSLSTLDDSASSFSENDRTNMWIASLDINLEGSQSVQKKNDEVGLHYSDFSSPSRSSKFNSQSESSFSSSKPATYFHLTEASRSSSSEVEYDEPLFWPYHENSYKISKPDESCLCISPRKSGRIGRSKEINLSKSVEVKLKKTNSMPVSRKCLQSPVSSQTPKNSATVGKKIAITTKCTQKSIPSSSQSNRFSPQVSYRLVRCESSTKQRNSFTRKETQQLKPKNQMHKQESFSKEHLLDFEANFFQESLAADVTIEKIIGLDEFDGHEGLNACFSEEFCFSL